MDDTSLGADLATAMGESTSSASDSAATVETSAQPGAATTEPAAGSTTTTTAGPIPFDVHKTALDNARTKAVEEWKTKYGWAEQVDPQQLQNAMAFYAQYEGASDPVEFLQQLAAKLQADPTHGPKLKSLHARALAAARGQGQASETPDLNSVIVDLGNGQQLPLSALSQQMRESVMRELAPQLAELQTIRHQREQDAANAFGVTAFEQLKTLPDFETHKADVAAKLAQMTLPKDASPEMVLMAARAAYAEVVPARLNITSRQSVIQDMHTKSQVNTVSPTQQTAGTPKDYKDMSWSEAFQHELAAKR
jgi:hypothetical protein